MPKKLNPKREKQLKQLLADLKEANKDPHYRRALREFIAYHTGTGRYSE